MKIEIDILDRLRTVGYIEWLGVIALPEISAKITQALVLKG